jgi:hypothetical protein
MSQSRSRLKMVSPRSGGDVSLSRWLRSNAEHYLLVESQERIAQKYGHIGPQRPRGGREFFWRRVFAPTYRQIPWRWRQLAIQRMPGSHRQQWTRPPTRHDPAV